MAEPTATDRRLLAALRDDARASITELALIAGVSRTTVRSRLDGLVREGRIRRFTIETDLEDEDAVRAITMVELQGRMSREVIRKLRAIPEVSAVHSTSGAWDLVVELRARSLAGFDRALRELREIQGVSNSETSLLLARAPD
ncbi:DNA-binding transcriptional regulator, Lrp family [Albimonas donghaensis]|uniref:DNA-binding transcriptional regulator, Lrp family n=1 Tax=Albimonas donghaensis TaxID=356660 RepID=A0A1H3AXI3_9RHOB|nr:Lrp/AsnC family transcriptional regulator [Albimonas donghaensis]SDX34397.1 DNA-binding transcriptional regulator, Lrp family [Albimonas donghaensis]